MHEITKEFVTLRIDEIVPYENNPRNNDEAVEDVVESIKQCGQLDPIEVDENNVILSGHTRHKAYTQLGYESVDVLRISGLTETQKRKYRLLANKTGEKASWDIEKLEIELAGLEFEGFDFGFEMNFVEREERIKESVEVKLHEKFQLIIDCENEQEMKKTYDFLQEASIQCRISTL